MSLALFLLLLLDDLPSAPQPMIWPYHRAEPWQPYLSWGCKVQQGEGRTYGLNGVIAQRTDSLEKPDRRHQRGLWVMRDDSGAFARLSATSPRLVERPGQFAAYFRGSKVNGPKRILVLKVDRLGGPGTVELYSGEAGGGPYATGECVTRADGGVVR